MADLSTVVFGRAGAISPFALTPATLNAVLTSERLKLAESVTGVLGDPLLVHAQGLPLIVDTNWATTTEDGWVQNVNTCQGPQACIAPAVVSDPTAPISPNNVLEVDMAGCLADGAPVNTYFTFGAVKTELYMEWWIKLSSNFPSSSAGVTKVNYFLPTAAGSAWWGLFCNTVSGNCASPPTVGTMTFGFYGQWDPFFSGDQHVPHPSVATPVFLDTWTKLATYVKYETTYSPHSMDGIVAWWVNDIKQDHLTNYQNPDEDLIECQLNPIVQNAIDSSLHAKIWYDHVTVRGQ